MRPTHILILLLVLIVLFGAKRLPDVARSVGQSMKVFKKEVSELQEDDAPASAPAPTATTVTHEDTPPRTTGTASSTPAAPQEP